MFNVSAISRACERSVDDAENEAKQAENRVSGSGAVSGHSRKRLSESGA